MRFTPRYTRKTHVILNSMIAGAVELKCLTWRIHARGITHTSLPSDKARQRTTDTSFRRPDRDKDQWTMLSGNQERPVLFTLVRVP